MRRRVGVGLGLAAIIVAVLVWRCRGEAGRNAASGTPVAKPQALRLPGDRPIVGRLRSDPKALARGSLAGTITDATTKAPVAGAQVCADGWSNDLADEMLRDPFCADTDAAGRYELSNLLPATYFVHASARSYRPELHHPGGDPRNRFLVLAAAERRTGVDIAMRPGGVEITGTVADLTGGPIAHARVRGGGGRLSGSARAASETDDHGRFSLWVSPGRTALTATAEGYAPQNASGRAPGKFEILLTPEASFAGTVVDAATGQPVEGARVDVSISDGVLDDRATTFSGPNGAYRIGDLLPGRYAATARTEHGYGHTDGSLLVGLGQHVDGVVVRLSPALRIEGKVIVASTQRPCADGDVKLRDTARRRELDVREAPGGIHVADGALPGTYSVDVSCSDFLARDSYPPVTITDQDVTGVVWEVDAGATLRGKVTTKAGEPVDGARLSAHPVTGNRASDWRSERTAYDGAYQLLGLRPGTYSVDVSSEHGLAPPGGFNIDIASGAVIEHDFVLDDGGTIKGVVVDPDGKPVGGMYIIARVAGAWRPSRFDECKSDGTGAFTCEAIPEGDYRVVAHPSRFVRPSLPGAADNQGEAVAVRAGQVSTVKLVVEAQSGTIRGTVTDGDGRPIGDAFVSAAREADAIGGRSASILATRWSLDARPHLTATDGAFTVPGLAPGNYTLRAYRTGGGEAIAEHVAVGSTVSLQIKPTGSVEGTARRSGDPPAEISVSVDNPVTWLSRHEQFDDTNGHYIVRDLPQGHLRITIETQGARKQLEIDLAEGENKTGVDVVLDDLVTLTGRVVERGTTTPVAGVRMTADMLTAGRSLSRRPSDDSPSFSDDHGRFTIRNVSRGKLTIIGLPRGGMDSGYGYVRAERTIDGTGTIDVGDVEIDKRAK